MSLHNKQSLTQIFITHFINPYCPRLYSQWALPPKSILKSSSCQSLVSALKCQKKLKCVHWLKCICSRSKHTAWAQESSYMSISCSHQPTTSGEAASGLMQRCVSCGYAIGTVKNGWQTPLPCTHTACSGDAQRLHVLVKTPDIHQAA